jgi:hypothetical protein
MAKIQELVILPMKTQGVQDNKTVTTISTNKHTQFVRITIMLQYIKSYMLQDSSGSAQLHKIII